MMNLFVPKHIAAGRGAGRAANHLHYIDHFTGGDPVNAANWIVQETAAGDGPDPIAGREGGVIQFPGDGTASAAGANGLITYGLHWQPANQGWRMYCEAKIQIVAAITNSRIMVGWSDSTADEIPLNLDAAGDITASAATDAAVVIFDSDQTTDVFRLASVDTDVDQTTLDLGVTPVADQWYIMGVEIDSAGAVYGYAYAYDDQTADNQVEDTDVQIFSLNKVAGLDPTVAITPTVVLTPGIWYEENGTTTRLHEADYCRFGGMVVTG